MFGREFHVVGAVQRCSVNLNFAYPASAQSGFAESKVVASCDLLLGPTVPSINLSAEVVQYNTT